MADNYNTGGDSTYDGYSYNSWTDVQVFELIHQLCRDSETMSFNYQMVKDFIASSNTFRKGINDKPQKVTRTKDIPDKNEDLIRGLDTLALSRFERAFGADFSDVRIHTGKYADYMANIRNALAVTIGNDIYFKDGAFSLDTEEGQKLLAHELQHVVQASNGEQMVYLEDIENLEQQADSVESGMENVRLHNLNAPHFNQSSDSAAESNDDAYEKEKSGFQGSPSNLDEMQARNGEQNYRVIMSGSQKIFYISKSERMRLLDVTSDKLNEYINEKISILPDDRRDELLMEYLNFINNRST